jgi:hypothetical protein
MIKSRSFLVSLLVIFVTSIISFIIRYIIMVYGGIDLFNLVNNPTLSFIFCFGVNVFRKCFRTFLEEYLDYHYGINLTTEAGPSTGATDFGSTDTGPAENRGPISVSGPTTSSPNIGGTNPDGTNRLRVGRLNGSIRVADPLNQISEYKRNGNNQPLLRNIARELAHQKNLGHTTLNKYTFTPAQEKFVLQFLLFNHRDVYDRIMSCERGQFRNVDKAKWWRQTNSKSFRDLLLNGR